MSTPSAEQITELAPMWESVSIREAGHAVAGVLLGVPVHHVRLDYQRMGLGRWEVVGYTGIGDDGHSAILDERIAVLFTLAGLEAESMHISTVTGRPLKQVRGEVESRKASRGDVDTIRECLPDAGITLDQAAVWANTVLCDQWQTVVFLAEALREHRYLAGADVARLV